MKKILTLLVGLSLTNCVFALQPAVFINNSAANHLIISYKMCYADAGKNCDVFEAKIDSAANGKNWASIPLDEKYRWGEVTGVREVDDNGNTLISQVYSLLSTEQYSHYLIENIGIVFDDMHTNKYIFITQYIPSGGAVAKANIVSLDGHSK